MQPVLGDGPQQVAGTGQAGQREGADLCRPENGQAGDRREEGDHGHGRVHAREAVHPRRGEQRWRRAEVLGTGGDGRLGERGGVGHGAKGLVVAIS